MTSLQFYLLYRYQYICNSSGKKKAKKNLHGKSEPVEMHTRHVSDPFQSLISYVVRL